MTPFQTSYKQKV